MEKPGQLLPLIDLLPDITYWKGHSVYRGLQAIVDNDAIYKSNYLEITPLLLDLEDDDHLHLSDRFQIQKLLSTKIKHSVRFSKAKCMPSDPRVIAALDVAGGLTLYYLKAPRYTSESRPEYTSISVEREHHIMGGKICWNPHLKLNLAIPSLDGKIVIYDVNRNTQIFRSPAHFPVDASWRSENIVGTAGYDGKFKIWDLRTGRHFMEKISHNGGAGAISFSPFGSDNFLTGGRDGMVALWDMRNISHSLIRLIIGKYSVSQVSWSPHDKTLFAVCGYHGEAYLAVFSGKHIRKVHNCSLHFDCVMDMAWHPSENKIYCADRYGKIFSW